MNLLAQHEPCVCVHSVQRKSVTTNSERSKPQDGGVCELAHTLANYYRVNSSSSVASQSASSSGCKTAPSTSTLLALCRVIDNA